MLPLQAGIGAVSGTETQMLMFSGDALWILWRFPWRLCTDHFLVWAVGSLDGHLPPQTFPASFWCCASHRLPVGGEGVVVRRQSRHTNRELPRSPSPHCGSRYLGVVCRLQESQAPLAALLNPRGPASLNGSLETPSDLRWGLLSVFDVAWW